MTLPMQILRLAEANSLKPAEFVEWCKSTDLHPLDAANKLALEIARQYAAGVLDYVYCDRVMNSLSAAVMSNEFFALTDRDLPSVLMDVFLAFDAGEYMRSEDGPDVDPVTKYTKPMITRILEGGAVGQRPIETPPREPQSTSALVVGHLMRRKRVLTVALCVALAAAFAGMHIERYEDSLIFVTKTRVYDPIGSTQALFNQVTRDCSGVQSIAPDSPVAVGLEEVLSKFEVAHLQKTKLLRAMQKADWFIAEVEFTSLEPAIFLIQSSAGKFNAQPSPWSGSSRPFVPGPLIWKHFSVNAPLAPPSLARCFEPSLEHFQW